MFDSQRFELWHVIGLQLLMRNLTNQEATVEELNVAVLALTKGVTDGKHAGLLDKQQEMNESYNLVQVLAHDRLLQLQDKLREVCF